MMFLCLFFTCFQVLLTPEGLYLGKWDYICHTRNSPAQHIDFIGFTGVISVRCRLLEPLLSNFRIYAVRCALSCILSSSGSGHHVGFFLNVAPFLLLFQRSTALSPCGRVGMSALSILDFGGGFSHFCSYQFTIKNHLLFHYLFMF